MKKIPLNGTRKTKNYNKYFMLIDDDDYDLLNQFKWHLTYYGYATAKIDGKEMKAHRLILKPPYNYQVDHIDGDRLNNQRNNLRVCTNQQNLFNKKKKIGTSKYKGVSWYKGRTKWNAKIMFNYKTLRIGEFDSELHAAMAYDIWAKELFGEFARLNF